MFRCGELADGALLAALINLNYDAMDEIPLACRKTPASVKVLDASGEWIEAECREENGTIYVKKQLLPNLPLIMKLD